jgi:hemoglobin
MSALFDRIGAARLRAVIADFYDRVFADVMIGYLFAGRDKQRLIDLEWELAARQLGAPQRYTGRPMREVHAPLRIFVGQFDRRLQLLRNTLADHQVDPAVGEAWIAHQLALRDQVIAGACD